jgi:hypothetical protein
MNFRIGLSACGALLAFGFLAVAADKPVAPASVPSVSCYPFPAQMVPGRMTFVGGSKVSRFDNTCVSFAFAAGEHLQSGVFRDRMNGVILPLGLEMFSVQLQGEKGKPGVVLASSKMKVVSAELQELPARPESATFAGRMPGRQYVVTLQDEASGIRIAWRLIARDGSNYFRQEIEIFANEAPLPIDRITVFDLPLPGAAVVGSVRGSPVVRDNLFLGCEHPGSEAIVDAKTGRLTCWLARGVAIPADHSYVLSSVIGASPRQQMRRAFTYYLERERAYPYRPFLHYNSWYDIGCFNKYSEKDCLEVVEAFGTELTRKRGVKFDSFLFDDGWDNNASLWEFHGGFPNGLKPVAEACAKYGFAPGIWLSPWGGYGDPRKQRIAAGRPNGYETKGKDGEDGFVLSAPKYYQKFHDTCIGLVKNYGVNHFKFDGISSSTETWSGSEFSNDFDAAIQLIRDLRAIKPDIYINLTTGTWPSPFWLREADSIWRGGWDHELIKDPGFGSDRNRWLTYRDGDTYERVVSRGPFYPLNSLMLHGVIYAKQAHHLMYDPNNDLKQEIRSAFGSGNQLQELYITPALMKPRDWDELATAAKWLRRNAFTLQDTHWVGGNPNKGEIYGWASWSTENAILVLRNPTEKEQVIAIDAKQVFELPVFAPRTWNLISPYKDQPLQSIDLIAGVEVRVTVKPCEVLVFEANPKP